MSKGTIDEGQKEEFIIMLRAYSEALSKAGESEKAEEISREADEV